MSVTEAFASRWNRFFFEHDVLRARLTAFRVVFFGLLAFDLWVLMVPHAPRHADGAFNVSHVPFLDVVLPAPNAVGMTALYLVAGFLAMRIALGLATRVSIVALTILYSVAYFWSQVDSYQHHYLICLLLLLSCFVPFDHTPGLDRARKPSEPASVRSWAARLIYVQVSIVYFFTATTKVDEHWLNGWALEKIIQVEWVRDFYAATNEALGWSDLGAYAFVAHAIMIWQFFVAVAFLFPKLRPAACLTGPMFHILVELIDLKIGWFSYYMIGIYYLLLFPDTWFLAIAKPARGLGERLGALFDELVTKREEASVYVACGVAGLSFVAVALLPLEGAVYAAVACGVASLVALWPRAELPSTSPLVRAAAHLAIAVAMLATFHATDATYDYYRFWAGDLARRGQLEQAAQMYERANAARPNEPARHFQLARVYERLDRPRDAERAYRVGLAREPDDARATRALSRLTGGPP